MADEKISSQQFGDMVVASTLGGAARALKLLERTPKLFAARGWPADPDLLAVANAAIGCVAVGARQQRFRLPAAAAGVDKWRDLPTRAMAHEIVSGLDLYELLTPP